MWSGSVLVAAALGSPHAGASLPPPAPALVSQAQSGKTYGLAPGRETALRLSGRWGWTPPRASGRGLELIAIEYFRDPGYHEWRVVAVARGTFTIRSRGTPGCTGCGLAPRSVLLPHGKPALSVVQVLGGGGSVNQVRWEPLLRGGGAARLGLRCVTGPAYPSGEKGLAIARTGHIVASAPPS